MQNLKVFLHTSTYFVNSHLPRHTLVKEQIYRLPINLPQPGAISVLFLAGLPNFDAVQAAVPIFSTSVGF